jgi:alpha-tubulin suppressor-like RCC1 family protein
MLPITITLLVALTQAPNLVERGFDNRAPPKGRNVADGFHSDIDETSVSSGFRHTCAIEHIGRDYGGKAVCWGKNDYDQTAAPAGEFIQISAGQFHTCGVKVDETIKCWGAKGVSQDPVGLFHQVSAGAFHTCGVLKDGGIRCWGKDSHGQSSVPDGKYVQVSSGKEHSCGIKSDGTVKCWGSNSMVSE